MSADLNDLWLFLEVARAGSITAAARRLELPKSTVSRRLIRFEEETGAKLLHKTTRRIVLTETGEEFLERCEGVAREMDAARAFLGSVTTRASGTLRVTMVVDLGVYWLADFFVAFARRHPELRLDLDFTARRVDLIGERYDVAIRIGPLASSTLVARRFMSIDRGLYASPAYLAEAGMPADVASLGSHRFVMLEAHTHPPQLELVCAGTTARAALHGSIVSNSLGMVRALTLAGGGIGALPQRMCVEAVASGALVRILPGWEAKPVGVSYVIPARRLLPAKTKLFVAALSAHFDAPDGLAQSRTG
jgi:DNA-binding transcriptional LysR family regulator